MIANQMFGIAVPDNHGGQKTSQDFEPQSLCNYVLSLYWGPALYEAVITIFFLITSLLNDFLHAYLVCIYGSRVT